MTEEREYKVTVEQTVQRHTYITAESAEEAQRSFEADPYAVDDFYGEEYITDPEVAGVEEVDE